MGKVLKMEETIFSVATPRGKSGVAIIRVSGKNARLAGEVFGVFGLKPREALLKKLTFSGEAIDQALMLYFPEGKSFTGEEVLEFHVHGSLAITNKILNILSGLQGFRPAEAGEFSRRALINGAMGLTQIEGLADLLDAETEAQRRQAQKIFSGVIARKGEQWRNLLIRAAALIESTIDFVDEDIPESVFIEIEETLRNLYEELVLEVSSGAAAERLRDGYEVALIGAPNVGKSSLLNYLAKRNVAITSDIAGTTRDVIELRVDIKGLPVTFLDTAGLRDAESNVEKIGVMRTRERAEKADLRVLLVDSNQDTPDITLMKDDIILRGKADVSGSGGEISSKTGYGVGALLENIYDKLSSRSSENAVLVRERHRLAVQSSISALKNALICLEDEQVELVAAEIRSAIRGIEILVGRVDVDDLLDEIFSSFCIGK